MLQQTLLLVGVVCNTTKKPNRTRGLRIIFVWVFLDISNVNILNNCVSTFWSLHCRTRLKHV